MKILICLKMEGTDNNGSTFFVCAMGACHVVVYIFILYGLQLEFGLLSQLWQWYQPQPKPKTVHEKIIDHANEALNAIPWSQLLNYWFLLIPVFLLIVLRSKSARRVAYRVRGITYEALVDGSEFFPMKTPSHQVAIAKPGFLKSKHVGFGIRFGDYLVTPMHVWSHVADEALLTSSSGRQCVITRKPIQSVWCLDLAYIHLPPNKWADLSTTAAMLSKVTNSPTATCVGLKGASTGPVSPTNAMGMVSYVGSTEPGMSGASYHVGDRVLGMHAGVSGDCLNVGVSALAISHEISKMLKGEAANYFSGSGAEDIAAEFAPRSTKKQWREQTLTAHIDRAYEQRRGQVSSDWINAPDEPDYNQILTWEEADNSQEAGLSRIIEAINQTKLSSQQMAALGKMLSMPETQPMLLRAHTLGREFVDAGPSTSDFNLVQDLLNRVATLESTLAVVTTRLADVEKNVASLNGAGRFNSHMQAAGAVPVSQASEAVPQTMLNPQTLQARVHKCKYCNRLFKSPASRIQHTLLVHPGNVVSYESAFSSDSNVTMQTAPTGPAAFLGQTQSAPQNVPRLQNNLKRVNQAGPYLSRPNNQSRTQQSRSDMQQLLELLPRLMDSLRSVAPQN